MTDLHLLLNRMNQRMNDSQAEADRMEDAAITMMVSLFGFMVLATLL